uniref:Uncharacterized protein n=1 Tax=Myoviridae sp. ctiil21 TaxID=2825153 RepID=A0A8S5P6H8_9CAUD|nr:MAG TPA: hypothetical protein [Myoviridae sp. ctiil21]
MSEIKRRWKLWSVGQKLLFIGTVFWVLPLLWTLCVIGKIGDFAASANWTIGMFWKERFRMRKEIPK